MDSTTILVRESTLTDGSKTYAVQIEGETFECVTERDAYEFAEAFNALVHKHTNIEASVWYGY